MNKALLLSAALLTAAIAPVIATVTSPALAADKYVLDASHSQIVFTYNHLGFSLTTGIFSGFDGELMLDEENPENSKVSVKIKADSLITGWAAREKHFMNADFFDADTHPNIFFDSTRIDQTGPDTAKIQGKLYMNGISKFITLNAKLNKLAMHPRKNVMFAGFDATTTISRADFDMAMGAPFVSNDVEVSISIEAMKAE